MFLMYDSTTPEVIPAQPHAVIGYLDGDFANYDEVKRRFPHARVLGMRTRDVGPADAYDLERYDFRYDQAAQLYKVAHAAGVWRPCFYYQLSADKQVRDNLLGEMSTFAPVRMFVAYWNHSPDLPPYWDAHQFTNRALGRNLDESICATDFFQPIKPAPDRTARATVSFDIDGGSWTVEPAPLGETTK